MIMPTNIGPKIGIQGEAQFRQEIKSINVDLKTLGTEMQAVTSAFIGNEHSIEALTEENRTLGKTVDALKAKLETQQELWQRYVDANLDATDAGQRLKQDINRTTAALNKAEAQMRQNTEAIDNYDNAQEDASGGAAAFADKLGELGINMGALTMAGAVGMAVEGIKQLVGWLTDAIDASREYADEIQTLSTNYGIATDALQEYQYMSDLIDTDVGTITSSISKLTKSMSQARSGNQEMMDAFALLGVKITETDGSLRDADEVFQDIISSLNFMGDGTERDALTMQIFGKSALELNSIIAAGADGIDAYAEQARKMGYVLSDEDLAALGKLDDEFKMLDMQMDVIKKRIAVELAPALISLAERALAFAETVDWEEFGSKVVRTFKAVGEIFARTTPFIAQLANAIRTIADAITAVRSVFGGGTPSIGRGGGFGGALASGGVIEPNNPALYVLGDNPTEREIVAPRSEMVSAVREALGGGGAQTINIRFEGSLAQLGRVLQPVITGDGARVGATL